MCFALANSYIGPKAISEGNGGYSEPETRNQPKKLAFIRCDIPG